MRRTSLTSKRLQQAVADFEKAIVDDFREGRTVIRRLEIRMKRGRLERVFTESRRQFDIGDDSSTGSASLP
jgi:hypothetical protein